MTDVTAEHTVVAEWDAAYVLGALTPADRRRYEAHVDDCLRCRTAVTELSGLPGLLASVPLEQALTSAVPAADPPPDLLPRLITAVHRRRVRRIRLAVTSGLVAAAAVVLALVLLWPSGVAPTRPTTPVAAASAAGISLQLQQVVANPLTAQVTLVPEPWGTRLNLKCGFAPDGGTPAPDQEYGYTLFVTNRAGRTAPAVNWTYGPGAKVEEPVGSSRWPVAQIAVIEIRNDQGTTLLRTTR